MNAPSSITAKTNETWDASMACTLTLSMNLFSHSRCPCLSALARGACRWKMTWASVTKVRTASTNWRGRALVGYQVARTCGPGCGEVEWSSGRAQAGRSKTGKLLFTSLSSLCRFFAPLLDVFLINDLRNRNQGRDRARTRRSVRTDRHSTITLKCESRTSESPSSMASTNIEHVSSLVVGQQTSPNTSVLLTTASRAIDSSCRSYTGLGGY